MPIKNVITTGAEFTPRTDPVLEQRIQKDFVEIKTPSAKMLNVAKKKKITDGKLYTYASYTSAPPKVNAHLEVTGLEPSPAVEYQTVSNALQILKTDVMVSHTMQAAARTDGKTTMAAEIVMKKQEHDNDLDYAIMKIGANPTDKKEVKKSFLSDYTIAIDNTQAGVMKGLGSLVANGAKNFVNGRQGNIIAFDDKSDWTGKPTQLKAMHLDYMARVLNESGITPNKLFLGADLKEAFNHEMARIFKHDTKLVNNIESYANSYSPNIELILYHLLSEAYSLEDVVIMGDFSFFELCYLINTNIQNVITDKTAISKRIFTQATIALRNHKSIVIGVGLKGLDKKAPVTKP